MICDHSVGEIRFPINRRTNLISFILLCNETPLEFQKSNFHINSEGQMISADDQRTLTQSVGDTDNGNERRIKETNCR